jgi:hypothetical protein
LVHPLVRRTKSILTIEPFRLRRNGQIYVLPATIRVDLAALRPGRYRVLAVHNFHVEDDNPDLDSCVAGVYLAARSGNGRWEEPERFPVECRTLEVLGEIDVP